MFWLSRDLAQEHNALKNIGFAASVRSDKDRKIGMQINRGSQTGAIVLDHDAFQHGSFSSSTRCFWSVTVFVVP
jgi:hypothetical protein